MGSKLRKIFEIALAGYDVMALNVTISSGQEILKLLWLVIMALNLTISSGLWSSLA